MSLDARRQASHPAGVPPDRVSVLQRAFDRGVLLDLAVGTAVVAALALPVVLSTRAFFGDWGNHLYLVDQQARWLRHHLIPTYFLHSTESGAFYPHYMFYGGSLYAVTGWLSVLLGSSVTAYRLTFVMAFAACYYGTFSTARQLGVRRLLAHIPSAVAVSGAYFVTLAYDGGSWTEFIAVSMIPLVVASALSIIRSHRIPLTAATLLVLSTFLLTGSHSITLVCGVLFLGLIAAICALIWRRSITRRQVRRCGIVGALMALAAALNGWFLVPLARYASSTTIGSRSPDAQWRDYDYATRSFDSLQVVFNPLRTFPVLPIRNQNPFYVQAPVYALVWLTCLSVFLLLWRRRSSSSRAFWALVAVLGGLLTLVVWQGVWDYLPNVFKFIQFRFRLHTYINHAVVGLVIVGLLLVGATRAFRAWVLALALATGATVGLAIWQAWTAPTFLTVGEIVKTGDHLPEIEYANCLAPCPSVETDYRSPGDVDVSAQDELDVDVSTARTGTAEVRVPAGGPYRTNVVWSPVIEAVGGAKIVGATKEGWAVLAAEPRSRGSSSPARAEIRPRSTGAVIAGRAVSATAVAVLLSWLIEALAIRARHSRRRTEGPPVSQRE